MVSSPEELIKNIDENTIAVGAVLGTTFTGAFDDVLLLNKMLNEYEEKPEILYHCMLMLPALDL
ncbi:pyridoxal-dependent decarboxylase [Acidiplasma cupricumulans]|uniref:pyridoxal-dependent decarboxylase n=1 Tax=Acidiplasma cupricumulans TaxID=312540 RepID=UPI000781C231|nr:pyridoxal-dependent decarboxylase [Acidiplasma cupricumulans]